MGLNYSGRRALILGGSCELGVALALRLAEVGVFPLATYRSESGRQRLEGAFQAAGRTLAALRLDLAEDAPGDALAGFLEGGVDYCIDFAQEDFEALVGAADPGRARRFFQASVAARFEIIHGVARKMLAARGGRMVYVSSVAAEHAHPGQGFYAAAKQASEAIYRNIGLELAGRGITTVTLRPGYVNAGRGRRYWEAQAPALAAKIPLGRALEIPEVVSAIMFLLSDDATGINATAVTMDGGLAAGK